jgi:Domain of unknown function (DUF2019)
MKQPKLEDMTMVQLVEHFTDIALAQDNAMRRDDNADFNRLFWRMEAIEEELKRRKGDQRRALLPLFGHPNAQVRLKSAIATLAVAPNEARQTLQIISDRQEYPQAADARGMMSAVDEGTYIPS